MVDYPHLGEQMTRLVRSLAAKKGWNMTATMNYIATQTHYSPDMIHRWRQGHGKPPSKTVAILAKIGKEEAHLDRIWGEAFLHAARSTDTAELLNALWGPGEIRFIPNNLPTPEHMALIGRHQEIADLLELLSPQLAAHLISVDGIGGVGKTALVLEVAYRCLRASTGEAPNRQIPLFDAIIFVSAKQYYLTASGLLTTSEAQYTLRDLYREVAQTLNRFEITQVMPEDQPLKVRDALSRQRTLLIVDNLETMTEKQEILAFLYRLPPQVKVVITTRERALFSPIRLEQLTEEVALHLIAKEAQEKSVTVSTEQALTFYRRIGGIPAALVYSIGQIAGGYSVKTVLDRVLHPSGDVTRFCFEGSVAPLRGKNAHQLLMAIAMFPRYPVLDAVSHAAGLSTDSFAVEEGLAQLQLLSLVSLQEGRLRMLPLTREFALAELAAYPDFEQEARKRWVEWYINFVETYGGKDWEEWHIKFDRIEEEWENLLAVFKWCADHERYDEIRFCWLSGGLLQFAYIYGYWDNRLTWLTWLIQEAERRGEWSRAAEAMTEKGYILTLMNRLEEAENLFRRIWDLRTYTDSVAQVKLAESFARFYIYQKQYTNALYWLEQVDTLQARAKLAEPEHSRRKTVALNFYGQIYFEMQDFSKAEICFRKAIEQAQTVSYQRGLIYAQKYLADIAIERGRLDEAELLLKMGFTIPERNKDKRRMALYMSSFAHLYKKRGSLNEALRWAKDAYDRFERLGMRREAEEMHLLLQELSA